MKRTNWLRSALALVTLAVCPSLTLAEELGGWARFPPAPAVAFFEHPISNTSWHVVNERLQKETQEALETKPLVAIKSQDARNYLSDVGFSIPSTKYTYLVRGVCAAQGGKVVVYKYGASIFVHYGAFGKNAALARAALIVFSDEEISDAYVGASLAE